MIRQYILFIGMQPLVVEALQYTANIASRADIHVTNNQSLPVSQALINTSTDNIQQE